MVLYLVQSAVLSLVQEDNGTVPCTECNPVFVQAVMVLYLVQSAVMCLVQAGNGTVPCTECSTVSCTGR